VLTARVSYRAKAPYRPVILEGRYASSSGVLVAMHVKHSLVRCDSTPTTVVLVLVLFLFFRTKNADLGVR